MIMPLLYCFVFPITVLLLILVLTITYEHYLQITKITVICSKHIKLYHVHFRVFSTVMEGEMFNDMFQGSTGESPVIIERICN